MLFLHLSEFKLYSKILYICHLRLIELLKELANVVESFGQSGFSTQFISISSINCKQLKRLQGAPRSRFRSIFP